MDSLPDFYGAAFVGAHHEPQVQVYVLSDTCLAVCDGGSADSLCTFTAEFAGQLQSDGILHQIYLGYGSFAERAPEFGGVPSNFFGKQIVGTAIVDAVDLSKEEPFGSRILVSREAIEYLPGTVRGSIVCLPNGEKEFLPDRTLQCDIFDCIYYFLCLRDHAEDSRSYRHYIWSLASRCARLGADLTRTAAALVVQHASDYDIQTVFAAVNKVLRLYEEASSVTD